MTVYKVFSKPSKLFASLEEASAFASSYAEKSGIVVAVEKAKPKKLSAKKLAEARVSRAIVGFQIPMLSIPKLCKALNEAIAFGKSDEELKAVVAAFPGIIESN